MNMLQEPVKRNPTHVQLHPALSLMLIFAVIIWPSPSPLRVTKAGRKHAMAGEQRMAAGLSRSAQGSSQEVFFFP